MMMFLMSEFWIVVGLILFFGAGLILLTDKPKWNDFLAFGLIMGVYLSAWLVLHPRQTVLTQEAREVQAMIGKGTPVLLEFQSPF